MRADSSAAGPWARYRERVGGSRHAKMSKPVTDSALATACPGKGLPNVARAEIENCGHLPHYTHPDLESLP